MYHINHRPRAFWVICLLCLLLCNAQAQPVANTDETKAGSYTLPPLLRTGGGTIIKNARQWEAVQRPLLLQLFTDHVYGRVPGRPSAMHYKTIAEDHHALNGSATRKEVVLYFTRDTTGPSLHLLLYLPRRATSVPVFMGLNFQGNHSVQRDTAITITRHWKNLHPSDTILKRGAQETRWPVALLVENGFALATAWYQDLEPDHKDGWRTGIRSSLQQELSIEPDDWGAVAAWAWGMSRIMDYLEGEPAVDARKVVLTGHSRIGKAALWAAANDRRFAAVVSNNSGEGGAALARRNFGETVARINTAFPHWFVNRYKHYNDSVQKLPVDQHMLLALIAPRPLYVASAVDDTWADPKGEMLAAVHASQVYRLYGRRGLERNSLPPLNQPAGTFVRYHIRTGIHDITLYDWEQYIQFAKQLISKK